MPKKLLLAEDSLTIRKVFELALSRSDISITGVDNGEDAVRLAGEILPDLVVADLTLPGKNGLAVAAELRSLEKTEKIPVLILSGTLVPLDEARFKASGAKGILLKPFEARELIESIERILRESAPAPEPLKTPEAPEAPPADERWDFSDVMDEVEDATAKPEAPAPTAREGAVSGAILHGGEGTASPFDEFDVSIEEIEGGPRDVPAEPPTPPYAPTVEHVECAIPADSPPPVTDLSAALDLVEEIEETGEVEPLVEPGAPAPPAAAEPVAAEAAVPEPVARERDGEAPPPAPPGEPAVPHDAVPPPGDAELREFFAVRAGEIFRTVASEAVEKVMWEMTDRLAAEFSAKLRESVEAVAWEVIPSTAEALIREEIARIRGLAGKPSP